VKRPCEKGESEPENKRSSIDSAGMHTAFTMFSFLCYFYFCINLFCSVGGILLFQVLLPTTSSD